MDIFYCNDRIIIEQLFYNKRNMFIYDKSGNIVAINMKYFNDPYNYHNILVTVLSMVSLMNMEDFNQKYTVYRIKQLLRYV
jgi:vancomycin permeability regulator SanA